jgi:hypothetical protein
MVMDSLFVFNLVLLAVVLESDLGRRRVGLFRVVRPLIGAALITPFFIKAPATNGVGLALEVGGVGLGLVLGLTAASLLPVYWDASSGRAYSRGGLGYALFWLVLSAAREAFAYGSQHVFAQAMGSFMLAHQIGPYVLADSLIAVFLTTYLVRTVWLIGSRRAVTRRARLDEYDRSSDLIHKKVS